MMRLLWIGLSATVLVGTAAELAPAPRSEVVRPGPVSLAGTLGAGGILELDVPVSVPSKGLEGLTELAVENAPARLLGQHVRVRGTLAAGADARLLDATFR